MTRRFIKFIGKCKVTKVVKKGRKPVIFMKCQGKPKTKSMSAQEILESVR